MKTPPSPNPVKSPFIPNPLGRGSVLDIEGSVLDIEENTLEFGELLEKWG